MNNVKCALSIMHLFYCHSKQFGTKVGWPSLEAELNSSLGSYARLLIVLEKLDIEDLILADALSIAKETKNVEQFFTWAKIDNNLASMGLNAHNRRKATDSDPIV